MTTITFITIDRDRYHRLPYALPGLIFLAAIALFSASVITVKILSEIMEGL